MCSPIMWIVVAKEGHSRTAFVKIMCTNGSICIVVEIPMRCSSHLLSMI